MPHLLKQPLIIGSVHILDIWWKVSGFNHQDIWITKYLMEGSIFKAHSTARWHLSSKCNTATRCIGQIIRKNIKILRNIEYIVHHVEPEKRQQCLPLIVCLPLMQTKWEYHLYTYHGIKWQNSQQQWIIITMYTTKSSTRTCFLKMTKNLPYFKTKLLKFVYHHLHSFWHKSYLKQILWT